MDAADSEAEELVLRAEQGDADARNQLLTVHRARLSRMIELRMDPRLSTRVDASDVVQETLVEADRLLPDYLKDRPLPFYPWLRQLAWNRLLDLHRRHVLAQRRSVKREVACEMQLADHSALELFDRLAGQQSSPSAELQRQDVREQVRQALEQLDPTDREVLVLRYLEQLSTSAIAAVLEVSEGAVKMRHARALKRMRTILEADRQETDS